MSKYVCACVALGLMLSGCTHLAVYQDVSPDQPNGHGNFGESAAGLTLQLAGDESTLFAVSLNAGVWRSVGGHSWQQLSQSPRYATSIAVDPTNKHHIAVGERNGDAAPFDLNRTGVWESLDNGDTWKLTFSPLTQAGCRARQSQAVPALLFTPVGTLLIGTACGVGRRAVEQTGFDFSGSPLNVSVVKAFAMSGGPNREAMVWARADKGPNTVLDQLLVSDGTDGASWTSVGIPSKVEGWGIGYSIHGTDFAIAAVGQTAILDFSPSAATAPSLNPSKANICTLLYFFRDKSLWHVQSGSALPGCGDGTGNGGRKSFFSATTDLSHPLNLGGFDPTSKGRAKSTRVLYNAAQDILDATGINPDGTLQWNRILEAQCGLGCSTSDNVHGDIWAVHVAFDSDVVRVAGDGGVYAREPQFGWVQQNGGLHTHHIHSLAVLPKGVYPRLAYVASDNSDWWRDNGPLPGIVSVSSAGWHSYGTLGDGSWVLADAGNPAVAILVRQANWTIAADFGVGMPSGAGVGANSLFTISCAPNTDASACVDYPPVGGGSFSPLTFQVIQTLPNEPVPPLSDVVMLVNAPVQRKQGGRVSPIPSAPGNAIAGLSSATGGPLLIRNPAFLARPDVNTSQFQGWQAVNGGNVVPPGTFAVWPTNGHRSPIFYVAATGASGVTIWKLGPTGAPWIHLSQLDGQLSQVPVTYAPLFVDPYDPDHLFVLANTGVLVPNLAAGKHVDPSTPFAIEPALTQLITGSGQYPIQGGFAGGNGTDVPIGTRGNIKGTLGAVAFLRGNSHRVLVASPVTGLYAALDDSRQWLSLSEALPQPFTMTSDVGLEGDNAYAVTEGRGIERLGLVHNAKPACFFSLDASTSPPTAKIQSTDGNPVASASLSLILVHSGTESPWVATTDAQGRVGLAGVSGDVVHVSFGGSDNVAPCDTAYHIP